MSTSAPLPAIKYIKKSLLVVIASAGITGAASANVQQWVTGNEQTNNRLQVSLEDKNTGFRWDYARALERRLSFDLDNAKFFANYNINSPTQNSPAYVNACQSYLADIYRRGHTNIFFSPQWQYGIRKYNDNFTTWYDLPPSAPVSAPVVESPCIYQFTPAIAEYIRTNYPYFHQDEIKIRARFGLVLSAINQFPAGLYSNASTPAFNLTPRPVGAFGLTKPAKVNLGDYAAAYTLDESNVFSYTGTYRTETIWGLVYRTPDTPALNYVASYPNYRYDSVHHREFLHPHGTQNRITLGNLYPTNSTNYSFPNGVPEIPENAQAYLRVEVRQFPKNFGAGAQTVFMLPHEDTAPTYEYGYRAPDGQFTSLAACGINFNDCFPADGTVDFLIRITDNDRIHSVTGNYYLGSSSDPRDRLARSTGKFAVTLYDRLNNPRGQKSFILTTGFNLAQAYELINREPHFFDKIYFNLRTRDYFGGVQEELYGLELPVRHTGDLRIGYSPAGNNETDVFADGSGLLTVDVTGVDFPGLAPYAYQWYLGTTAISGAVSASFYLRYNYVDYLEARQVPVKVKVAYTDGNLRYEVLEKTFSPVRLSLIENAEQFFNDQANPRIQSQLHGVPADWTFITSELLRNTDGGGSFQALPRSAAQSWPFTSAHWEDLYSREGEFPPPAAWSRRPTYKARFLMQQPDGFLVWLQSQLLEIPAPPVQSLAVRVALAPGIPEAPPQVVQATIATGILSGYLGNSSVNFVWQIAGRDDFNNPQNITVSNFSSLVELSLSTLALRGNYVRGRLQGRDRFGTEFSVDSNALNLYRPPTGSVAIELSAPYLTNTSQLTLTPKNFNSPGGTFTAYNWEIIDAVVPEAGLQIQQRPPTGTYQLTPNNLNMLRMGYVLKAEVVHRDWLNNYLTLTAYANYETLRADSNAPTEGGLVINGSASFTPGAPLTYLLTQLDDGNGIGSLQTQWYKKISANADYQALPGATDVDYTLTAADFIDARPNYPPRIRVEVHHIDGVGNANEEILADEISYNDQPPAPLLITMAARQSGSAVSLIGPVTDPNGIKNLSYRWQSGSEGFGVSAMVGTLAQYRIAAGDFNPHTHLRLVAAVEDVFGARVTLTSNHLAVAATSVGNISLNVFGGEQSAGATVTVLTAALQDPNGGTWTDFTWDFTDDTPVPDSSGNDFYVLTPAAVTALQSGSTLRVAAVFTDSLGFGQTLRAGLVSNEEIRLNHPLTGNLTIRGNASFGYETQLTADVSALNDQNGIANYNYQWSISYDAGATFTAVPYAVRSVFYHEIDDWDTDTLNELQQPPIVQVAVEVMDNYGYATTVSAQLQHQDAPPTNNLIIAARTVTPGSLAQVNNYINEPNVIRPGTLRHRWQTGAQEFNAPREVLVHYSRHRADGTNQYTLRAADFSATNEYLRLVSDYQDIFGARTTITSNIIKINQETTGTLNAMILGNRPTVGATLQVFPLTVTDPNGGNLVSYAWYQDNNLLATNSLIIIQAPLAEAINAGHAIRVEAQYLDDLGIAAILTATLPLQTTIEINYPTEGRAVIRGAAAFTTGAQYSLDLTELTDGNGRGVIDYHWTTQLAPGTNWQALAAPANENLTMHPDFFTGLARGQVPQIRAVLTHYDRAGFVQKITSNILAHRNQRLTGRLAISALQLTANGLVTVVELPMDGDGIREINYQWQAGNDLFFEVAEDIGANRASYRILPEDFNPQAVIRVIAEVIDHYNQVQKITSNHIPIASRTLGTLRVTLTTPLRVSAWVRPLSTELYDANGGQIVNYHWEINERQVVQTPIVPGENYPDYALTAPDVVDLAAGHNLTLVAVYADDLDYRTTLTARLTLPADAPSQVETLELTGANSFADLNEYTVRFSNLTDPNGLGHITYQWYQSGGENINYRPIANATRAVYQMTVEDFPVKGNNHLAVSVIHTDAAGYTHGWWRTLAHQDTAPTSRIALTVRHRTPGSPVRLISTPNDPNGVAEITYEWRGLLNATAITGTLFSAATETYHLPVAGIAPYEYLQVQTRVLDDFGGRVTLTSAPVQINTAPQGLLWIEAPATLTAGITLRVVEEGLVDLNGGALTNFTWRLDNSVVHSAEYNSYQPTAAQTEKLVTGAILAVQATHTDDLGFTAQLTATAQLSAPPPDVEILGDPVFADGNRYTAVLTAPAALARGQRFLALEALEVPGATIEYQWGYSEYQATTTLDGAGNINLLTVESGFIPLVNQTNSIYIMDAEIFQHGKKLMVMAMQIDGRGLAFGSQDTMIIENISSTGKIDFTLPAYTAGTRLIAAGEFYDTNGITATLWQWQSGQGANFDAPVDIQTSPAAHYTLNWAHFAPNDKIRVIANVVDSLDQTTKITTAAQNINAPTQGEILIHASPPLNGIVTLSADLSRLTDLNGPVTLVRQRWSTPHSTTQILISEYQVAAASANSVSYQAEVADAAGFISTLSTSFLRAAEIQNELKTLLPIFDLASARQLNGAIWGRLAQRPRARKSYQTFSVDGQTLDAWEDISQIFSENLNDLNFSAQNISGEARHKDSAWTFWGNGFADEFTGRGKNWRYAGTHKGWLLGLDKTHGAWRVGLSAGQDQVSAKITEQIAQTGPGKLTKKLNVLIPYIEFKKNNNVLVRGALGYGQGAVKYYPTGRPATRAALEWYMAGLNASYEKNIYPQADLKLNLGANAAKSRSGTMKSNSASYPAINNDFAYESYLTVENGYSYQLDQKNSIRPFLKMTGRAQHGTGQNGIIVGGGLGTEWQLPRYQAAGKIEWQRQLTDDKLNTKDAFALSATKYLYANNNLTLDTIITPERKWQQSWAISQTAFWGTTPVNSKIYLNYTDENYTTGIQLSTKFN